MGSTWGTQLRVSLFGESHGAAIGIVIDGMPEGEKIDLEQLHSFLQRRRPGTNEWSTPRQEADEPEILSGFLQNQTTGAPLTAIIKNSDTRSKDYEQLRTIPRPGHADITALMRYNGAADMRGSGHFSGRLTAPLCIAGGIASQVLSRRGISIAARILSIGTIVDDSGSGALDFANPDMEALQAVAKKDMPVISDAKAEEMKTTIAEAKKENDSVGGVIQVFVHGFPPGIGGPFFEGIEPMLAPWVYAIPAVKALSFGGGFGLTKKYGSETNDSPEFKEENNQPILRMKTNHAGGIIGGISNGMPLVIDIGIKPTASIGRKQKSVDLMKKTNTTLELTGRHDPCIVPRAVPVAESMIALGLLDILLVSGSFKSIPVIKK